MHDPGTSTVEKLPIESTASAADDAKSSQDPYSQDITQGKQEPLRDETKTRGNDDSQSIEINEANQESQDNRTFVDVNGWKFYPKHPVKLVQELHGVPKELPKLQHNFGSESADEKQIRLDRLAAVKAAFQHSWAGYKEFAWLKDELKPVSGQHHQSFGGWAATLVDSLDTLWMMGLKADFEKAVNATQEIDFSTTTQTQLSVFETTIRYLGGFLGAYDISDGKYPLLLDKAKEIGELLYCAFDTPNHMPVTAFTWKKALDGEDQLAGLNTILADIGSLSLEFTRLSQLTGDMKWYDAITRISSEFQKVQSQTKIPGLWPQTVNARQLIFTSSQFTAGALGDSMYEYLPKQHMLLGGRSEVVRYDKMYTYAITAIMNHIVFQPMLPNGEDILFLGKAQATSRQGEDTTSTLDPSAEHLACFGGGMVGVGAKLFDQPEQMNMARKLVDGCIWAYNSMPSGIMPENLQFIPCDMNSDCEWNQAAWEQRLRSIYPAPYVPPEPAPEEQNSENATTTHKETPPPPEVPVDEIMANHGLIPGVPSIHDRRYALRPEAIESVFVHYRLTGDKDLPDKAWHMFQSIDNATRTDYAHSAISDVTRRPTEDTYRHTDQMESFWLAETLKYFYLIFSEPDVVNLDTYVLNTEAHPFKRPTPGVPFGKADGDASSGREEEVKKEVKA